MVLGFLAFVVWSVLQADGFEKMHHDWGWGPDGHGLLHLFENVHMYLFLGMALNFLLAARLIKTVTEWQILFAGYENPQLAAENDDISAFRVTPPGFLKHDEDPRQAFQDLEKYFINAIERKHCHISLRGFDFSRYLSVCMDDVLADVINFSNATWCFILFIFCLHGITTYYFEYDQNISEGFVEMQLAIIVIFCPITAFIMALSSRKDIVEIIAASRKGDYDAQPAWVSYFISNQRLRQARFQIIAARTIEGLMFISAYALMRMVASKDFWTHNTTKFDGERSNKVQITLILYYLAIYLFVGYKLAPEALVSATVCFALPPYVDDSNWALALKCAEHAEQVDEVRQSEDRHRRPQPDGITVDDGVFRVGLGGLVAGAN